MQEFKAALKDFGMVGEGTSALTEAEIDILVQSVDKDKDGTIDYSEFWDRFLLAAVANPTDDITNSHRCIFDYIRIFRLKHTFYQFSVSSHLFYVFYPSQIYLFLTFLSQIILPPIQIFTSSFESKVFISKVYNGNI